jgi:hypothetical protein
MNEIQLAGPDNHFCFVKVSTKENEIFFFIEVVKYDEESGENKPLYKLEKTLERFAVWLKGMKQGGWRVEG